MYRVELVDYAENPSMPSITAFLSEHSAEVKAELAQDPAGYPFTRYADQARLAAGLYLRRATPDHRQRGAD